MTSRNKAFALLLITLLCFTCSSHSLDEDHACAHDEIEHEEVGMADIEEEYNPDASDSNRVLAGSAYPKLRFYPYFGFLGNSAFELYIKNELIPPVVAYYESALRVKYPVSGDLKLSSSVKTVCKIDTPSILHSGVAADFFMYYDTYDTDKFRAYSTSCYKASGSKRTIVARTMFNVNRFSNPKGNVISHEKNIYTVMHEAMHTLGFDSYQFKYYLGSNGKLLTGHVKTVKIGGETRTLLDVAPLTDKLRKFYGCPSLPGAIMENEGGSGTAKSHFETKYFMVEMMTSSGDFGRRVSEFSLAVLEGSGWYVPDYSYAEPFTYGQGQGCSFLNNVCSSSGTPKFEEYCSGSGRGCAATGRSGGTCATSGIMEKCRSYKPSSSYDCDNSDGADDARLPDLQVFGSGAGSKCFTGTLNSRKSSSSSQTSFCFKYTCSGSGSDTELQVQVGKNTLTCTKAGQKTISGYYGVIDCPDPLTFCSTVGVKYCPRSCMARGTCVNGKCQCHKGFKGTDCSMTS